MKKITKKLSIKFKILLGKRKESSMKLILDKKINKPKELWKILKSMGHLKRKQHLTSVSKTK